MTAPPSLIYTVQVANASGADVIPTDTASQQACATVATPAQPAGQSWATGQNANCGGMKASPCAPDPSPTPPGDYA